MKNRLRLKLTNNKTGERQFIFQCFSETFLTFFLSTEVFYHLFGLISLIYIVEGGFVDFECLTWIVQLLDLRFLSLHI